ncbi:MAG: NAD-dependent epimerase/dehydratase family protein [Lapillicoccus sp.]
MPVVAVVGPGEVVGVPALRIARSLAGERGRDRGVSEVRVLAPVRGTVDGVSWRVVDTSGSAVSAELAGVDVLVWVATCTDLAQALAHRAAARREALLRTGRALTLAASARGVRHVLVVTSAEVFGAHADNEVPLPDHAPRRAVANDGFVADLLAVEAFVEESREHHPDVRFTLVRPAALVGAGVDTALTRYFEAPRLLAVKGGAPAWQLCHVDDLASGIVRAVTRDLGTANAVTVGCDGALTLGEVERLSAMRRIEVGETTATSLATQLHRVGVLPAPASELAYVIHPWVVGSATLRARGWHPAYDNGTCLGVLLDAIAGRHAVAGRRVDRRDAALGAASAAVALGATAAVLRRARRH